MTKFKILSIAILGVALLFTSCKQEVQQASQQQALPLAVAKVPQKNVTAYTTYPTAIGGTINSEVRAKVPGDTQKVLVDERQRVNKGQVSLKLATHTLSQDAEAAKSRVHVDQSQ